MSEIVNLNKARKAKLKQREAAKAEENRVIHGLSGEDKRRRRLIHKHDEEKHEGHRLVHVSATKAVDEQQ